MSKESIVDATVPSAGRIYDYLLGGHHNFEVDRQAADRLLGLVPFLPKFARLQRWCLQDIARELTEVRKYNVIIDFASGLPTQDHIHAVVPEGTTVIYSDYDPVVVEYAREILGGTPNVFFFEADARRPLDLLHLPEVISILGDRRNVALVYWGIPGFLTDDEISYAAERLYQWAGKHSCWVFNFQAADVNPNNPAVIQGMEIYRQTGSPVYVRSKARYLELIAPWHPDELGLVSLLDWHGFDEGEMDRNDRDVFGPTGAGFGAYLKK